MLGGGSLPPGIPAQLAVSLMSPEALGPSGADDDSLLGILNVVRDRCGVCRSLGARVRAPHHVKTNLERKVFRAALGEGFQLYLTGRLDLEFDLGGASAVLDDDALDLR